MGDRLRSLQSELVNAETRWRARGDGMRQKPQDEAAAKASSIEGIGGLVSRLKVCALFAQYHELAVLDVDPASRRHWWSCLLSPVGACVRAMLKGNINTVLLGNCP